MLTYFVVGIILDGMSSLNPQVSKKNIFLKLLTSGLSEDVSISVSSKVIFIRILGVTAIPLLLPLIINSFIHKSYIHALFNSIFLASSFIGLIILKDRSNLKVTIYTVLTGVYSLLLYIILMGGSEIYDIFFIFIIPYLTYFLLECKVGALVNSVFLVIVSAALFFPVMPVYQMINNREMSIRMLITYIIMNIISFIAAFVQCRMISNLQYMAYYDYLTGLPNRKKLDEILDQKIGEAARKDKNIIALMLNIDRLKQVNDNYTHQIGDKILAQFVERLQTIITDDIILGRHASADFLIFGLEEKTRNELDNISDKIHDVLKKPFIVDKYQIKLSTCIGITHYPTDAITRTEILKNLDLALTQAKKFGPETTAYYNNETHKIFLENYRMGEILQEAYKRGEIFLVFQPKVNLKTLKVTGFEVLARWENNELGVVPPVRFIPIAEDIGIMPYLTEWILERSWEYLYKLDQSGFPGLMMSINLSPIHIRNANFLESFEKIIAQYGIDPHRVELEITEGLLLKDDLDIHIVLNRLSSLGFSLALDDFGTGYSSLSYLKKFKVNSIKIDRSFVMNIRSEDSSAEIVRAIVAMAKSLNLHIVAEGVEYREQLDYLMELGCDEIQGYYFSKPLLFNDLVQYITTPVKLI